jgi:5'-nucleotidase
VAAAMEGRNLGLPSIALSMVGERIEHYKTGAQIAKKLVQSLSLNALPSQTILNVNIPNVAKKYLNGLQVTRLGTRHNAEPAIADKDPRGRPLYWIGAPGLEADAGVGTDFYAIREGYVSITPLHIDLTHSISEISFNSRS